MVIQDFEKVGEEKFKRFTILSEGICTKNKTNGFVQVDFRLSDMESEGKCLFVNVSDNIQQIAGDYLPLDLDKEELTELIKYLQECRDNFK